MYVCMYSYYLFMYVYIYVCMYVCVYVCMYVCMCTYENVYIHKITTQMQEVINLEKEVTILKNKEVCRDRCTLTYCIKSRISVCLYVCIYLCKYACIRVHIFITTTQQLQANSFWLTE